MYSPNVIKETEKTPTIGVSSDAQELINKFEKKLKETLLSKKFQSPYHSIDDILVKKYHLKDIEKIESPDFRCKTEFISKGVRGNLQKAEGNVLSYLEGESIINKALSEELP